MRNAHELWSGEIWEITMLTNVNFEKALMKSTLNIGRQKYLLCFITDYSYLHLPNLYISSNSPKFILQLECTIIFEGYTV